MIKVSIPVEIDIEQIAGELVEKDIGGASYRYNLKDAAKSAIFERIKDWLLCQTDVKSAIEQLKEKGYTGEWLRQTAKDTVAKEVQGLVESHAKQWIEKQLEPFVRHHMERQTEKILLPMLQSFIGRVMVVDEKAIQEEMRSMEEQLNDVAKGAYESGQADAANQIRNSI